MNTPDLITIFGNISRNLYPVQHLITGFAYLLGVIFVITAISKMYKVADQRAQSSSREKMFVPITYLIVGALFIYLPAGVKMMSNTAFGVGNVLTYAQVNTADVKSSVGLLIRTAGVIWFLRGCVLLVHASEPGTQEGPKGMAFVLAGVLAINFDNSIAMANNALAYLAKITMAVKTSQGF